MSFDMVGVFDGYDSDRYVPLKDDDILEEISYMPSQPEKQPVAQSAQMPTSSPAPPAPPAPKQPQKQPAKPVSKSNQKVTPKPSEKALKEAARKQQRAANAKKQVEALSKSDELDEVIDESLDDGRPIGDSPEEYGEFMAAYYTGCMRLTAVQAMIRISNTEGAKEGLNKASSDVVGSERGQVSNIMIPTSLLRHMQCDIVTNSRVNHKAIITGFLYWYFGEPDDVNLDSDMATQVAPVLEALNDRHLTQFVKQSDKDRIGKGGAVVSAPAIPSDLIDKIDGISEGIKSILKSLDKASTSDLGRKVQDDKMYVALCYLIVQYLGLIPPVAQGVAPYAIDMLTDMAVWDMMRSVDVAYDTFKQDNGREIYRTKHHSKPSNKMSGTYDFPPTSTFQQPPFQPLPVDESAQDNASNVVYDSGETYNDPGDTYEEIEDFGGDAATDDGFNMFDGDGMHYDPSMEDDVDLIDRFQTQSHVANVFNDLAGLLATSESTESEDNSEN